MQKNLGIIVICSIILSGCSYFNLNKNSADDKYSRCKEIKRQMIYTNSQNNQMTGNFSNNLTTNPTMVGAQNSALQDNLNRSYRDEGCE